MKYKYPHPNPLPQSVFAFNQLMQLWKDVDYTVFIPINMFVISGR